MSGSLTDARHASAYQTISLTDFYREEFLKHRRCLEEQRECYTECAIAQVEAALTQVMSRLETLCRQQDCEQVVSQLLKQFDILTGLSAWSDPKTFH
jgi:hypothetical protein